MPTITRKHTGKVETGVRAVAPGIMRAAENGALPQDVRAARAGLIVPGITNARGKRTYSSVSPVPDVSDIIKRERAAREQQMELLRYMRAEYERIMRGE